MITIYNNWKNTNGIIPSDSLLGRMTVLNCNNKLTFNNFLDDVIQSNFSQYEYLSTDAKKYIASRIINITNNDIWDQQLLEDYVLSILRTNTLPGVAILYAPCTGNGESCSICYNPLLEKCIKLICGHVYHSSCGIKNWAIDTHTCPMCRANLLSPLNTIQQEAESPYE